MRIAALFLLLAVPCAVAAQAPPNKLEADLARAKADYDRDPSSADNAIWLGRRLAYLGRFSEAIDTFTQGILKHPGDARLFRHRGHRYITTRRFDLATEDLKTASQLIAGKSDEIEPDGAPNKAGIPRSATTAFGIIAAEVDVKRGF